MLAPQQVTWENPWEMPQALADSGLLMYVEAVNRNPERYTVAQVEARLWADLSRWGILDLADFVSDLVRPAFPGFDLLPDLQLMMPDLPHPERCGYDNQRWFLGAHWSKSSAWSDSNKKCTQYYFPDDLSTWPTTDIHSTVSDQNYTGPVWNSDKVGGVDMGANTRLWDKTFFYMGDTWRRGPVVGLFYEQDPEWCEFPGFWCSDYAVRNDAIAVSVDDDPTDGIDITVLSQTTGDSSFPVTFWGIGIPGVHNNALSDMWGQQYFPPEPKYSTPSSAATMRVPSEVRYCFDGECVFVRLSIPMVVVTYTFASSPEWNHTYELAGDGCTPLDNDDCDLPHSRKTPVTYLACSFDGIHFFACHGGGIAGIAPLSDSGFRYLDCQNRIAEYGPGAAGRFIGASLVEVGPHDLKSMCAGDGINPAYAPDSQMCELYDEEIGYGGLLFWSFQSQLVAEGVIG
jgi:hypothetical protein